MFKPDGSTSIQRQRETLLVEQKESKGWATGNRTRNLKIGISKSMG